MLYLLGGTFNNSQAGPRYRIHDPSTWGEQAAMAAEGKLKELKEWQRELKGGKIK